MPRRADIILIVSLSWLLASGMTCGLAHPQQASTNVSQETQEQNELESAEQVQSELGQIELVFEKDIAPLLAEKCGSCHSEEKQQAGLDLSSMEGIERAGESEEPLITESLEESLLWSVIESGEMPPDREPGLNSSQRNVIRKWLVQGARSAASESASALHQHNVLPILLLRCNTCHGPQRQDGGLDLRTRETMLAGGKSGPAFVPGNASESLMIKRIESNACPPQELLLKFFVRRPPNSEVNKLRQWIDAGAIFKPIQPDVATREPDLLVTDEDRQHWAFQPVGREFQQGSIDDFVLARLQEFSLDFSPEAKRETLVRRVYFDLIGLPPTVQQQQFWVTHPDADWYAQMVDQLLESPRYGERWGRYWLDLAGYADSEGGISADPIRNEAWKYRDYVIRSFNEDKPYDQFLLQQLAGDELIDYESLEEITDDVVDNLVATGFLRMGIDETGSRTMNFVPERLKVISDAITVVSSSLMGMTMECARCHSHKYDPIPHRDYYRFKAIFQGALDEHDWHSFKTRKLNVATRSHREQAAEVNPPLATQLKKQASQQKALAKQIQLELLQHHYPDQSSKDNEATLAALRVADNNRTVRQRELVEGLQRVEVLSDHLQPTHIQQLLSEAELLQRQMVEVRRQMVPSLSIRALWDLGRPSPTYVLRRGEHDKASTLVGPGVPSVLTDGRTPFEYESPFPDGTKKTGRRLAFAQWLVREDHPLTARVLVNRVWHIHFGAGIVRSLENFGRQGDVPSHPELLDWLAVRFMKSGWSIKQLHRIMLNSRTYKQSSRVTKRLREIDPENRWLSRFAMRRMDAEAIRDSLLFLSNKLDETPGGIPDPVSVDREGLVSVIPRSDGRWRRSVYLQFRRTEIPTMMATFDYPEMGPNCMVRSNSTVSPQSLMLMNNRHIYALATHFAKRILDEVGAEISGNPKDKIELNDEVLEAAVQRVYLAAFSRRALANEHTHAMQHLRQLIQAWGGDRSQAFATYCHTILNSAAFLYVD